MMEKIDHLFEPITKFFKNLFVEHGQFIGYGLGIVVVVAIIIILLDDIN